LLGSVEGTAGTVIADLEAGIGTLTRMGSGDVDVVLLVAEPTPKSIEVASRAADIAREKSVGTLIVVASRVRDAEDVAAIRGAFPDEQLVTVPYDDAIVAADREGVSPVDHAPDAPAVRALEGLAERLTV
jgi:CO dehydrogenase maturation factor